MAKIWWIKRDGGGRLGLMSKPDASHLEEQVSEVRSEGVDEIVCLLTETEMEENGLAELSQLCESNDIKFKRFSMPAEGVPPIDSGLDDFLQATSKDLKKGRSIVLQCNTGRGRCAMVAAALMALEGTDPETSMKALRAARKTKVAENSDQEQWIRMFNQQANPFHKPVHVDQPFYKRVNSIVLIGAAASLLAAVAAVTIVRHRRS